jgi:glycosyltransferase involved in cell wall biosynthesis
MVQLYNAVDIYVTPSLQDNLPNTIMEALACGIPCVGFKVGGIPEMIDHQENGYVAQYKDAEDFAHGILWTLSADYETLSRQARNKVMVTYSENAVAHKYMEVYEG